MPVALAVGAGLVGVAATTLVARRESRAQRDRTSGLLDPCRDLFETSRLVLGADRYPRLEGVQGGRSVHLAAVPDTLTLKRLPQLWLMTTLRRAVPIDGDLAFLARSTGAEFFALTHRLPNRLDVPLPLSPGLLARGSGAQSQALLDALAAPLADALADPRCKEIAVTKHGLRAVVQASEGRRGEYLLLRQSAFEGPILSVTAQAVIDKLLTLEAAVLASVVEESRDG